MNYYIEITLLPHAEIEWHFLWEKAYQQLHLGLVAMKNAQEQVPIGVAFPNRSASRRHLGQRLRLFAQTQEILEQFDASAWFKSLSDYVHLTRIKTVPEKIKGYGCYFRIQTKSNNEQLARRKSKAKKNALPFEEAMKHFATREEVFTDAPFVYLKSISSGKRFPLFIGYHDKSEATYQGFSCYGLSKQSTVPIF